MPQRVIECRWTRAHGYSEYSHRASSVRQWDALHYESAAGRGFSTERHRCEQSHARGRYSRVLKNRSATYLGRRQVAQPWHLTPSMRAAVGRCNSRLAQAPLRRAKRQRAPRRNEFARRGNALRGGAMRCAAGQCVAPCCNALHCAARLLHWRCVALYGQLLSMQRCTRANTKMGRGPTGLAPAHPEWLALRVAPIGSWRWAVRAYVLHR